MDVTKSGFSTVFAVFEVQEQTTRLCRLSLETRTKVPDLQADI